MSEGLSDAYIAEVDALIKQMDGTPAEQYRRMTLGLLLDIRERLGELERNPVVRFGALLRRDPITAVVLSLAMLILVAVYLLR